MELTQSYLKELFDYHPDGHLIWKVKKSRKMTVGSIAGGFHRLTGYARVCVDFKTYQTHRLIFLWHHGYLPKESIDHKDTDRSNNKIENLRVATKNQQQWNQKLAKNNTSGFKGVSFHKKTRKWKAQIRSKHLGRFDNPMDAAKAYDCAAKQLFGEFAKTNFESAPL